MLGLVKFLGLLFVLSVQFYVEHLSLLGVFDGFFHSSNLTHYFLVGLFDRCFLIFDNLEFLLELLDFFKILFVLSSRPLLLRVLELFLQILVFKLQLLTEFLLLFKLKVDLLEIALFHYFLLDFFSEISSKLLRNFLSYLISQICLNLEDHLRLQVLPRLLVHLIFQLLFKMLSKLVLKLSACLSLHCLPYLGPHLLPDF